MNEQKYNESWKQYLLLLLPFLLLYESLIAMNNYYNAAIIAVLLTINIESSIVQIHPIIFLIVLTQKINFSDSNDKY